MRTIAQKYQLDLQSLLKCIRDYNIPFRAPSDWKRIALGQKVRREPLSGDPDESVFVSHQIIPPYKQKPDREKESFSDTMNSPENTSGQASTRQFPRWIYQSQNPDIDYTKEDISCRENGRKDNDRKENGQKENDRRENDLKGNGYVNNNCKGNYRPYPSRKISNKKHLIKGLEKYDHRKSLYELLEITPSEEYQKMSVINLPLSVRAINALYRSKLDNLHMILSQNLTTLSEVRNLGALSIKAIIEDCKQYYSGYTATLKDDSKPVPDSPGGKSGESQIEVQAESSRSNQEESSSESNSLLVKLMMEFYKLNPTGQKIAIETVRAMTNIDHFKA